MDLKLEALRKYDRYQEEKTKLDIMIKGKLKGVELQSLKTEQAEKDWAASHESYIDALSGSGT